MKTNILKESSRGYEAIRPEDQLLTERKIFFTEEVTPESSKELIQVLLYLAGEDPDKEITLFINSPGGEVISGLAVYDTLTGISCPVTTVCIGTAASMGSILFLAGQKRQILRHSQVMIHDPLISGLSGSRRALELEKEAARLMELREIIGGIIAGRSGRTIEEVYENTREDTYLTAQEAVEFGIATDIVERI